MNTDSINLLITTPFSEESLQMISSISPRIKLQDVSGLVRAEYRGDKSAAGKLDILLQEAEVIYSARLPAKVLERAPNLKWIQVTSAGVDRFLTGEMLQSPVILTNASGIHATPIGEFILQFMLMFAKQAPFCFEMKQKKEWQRFSATTLRDKTVGIVGLGSIGKEAARLCKAFGMRVIAVRRSAKQAGRAGNVDRLLPPSGLPELLSESDYVVITLPYTPETSGLIGAEELRLMKSTAYIINIGRGRIIQEEALIEALTEKRIAGAGLDVFATEPLPPDSKLWELPNVIYSPHVSGGMEKYDVEATRLFCDNLTRYLNGKRLRNIINKKRGY